LILGTDRPAGADSGIGHVHADGGGLNTGTVHVIAGRKSKDPSFDKDSSFIYISQRTNADENLNLPNLTAGTTTVPAPNEPAIIVKSNNIRVVYRDAGDVRIVNDKGSSFIVISKDYIDSHVESDVWVDAGGVRLEVHKDNTVRLGPLAKALENLASELIKAIMGATTVSNTGNLGAPVPFGGSDLQMKLNQALTTWKNNFIEGQYIKDDSGKQIDL
jgi:hypothetical protein